MRPFDHRVVGEQPVDVAQRLEVEKPGDRVAAGESIRGANRAGELAPALGELGARTFARAACVAGPSVRRGQTLVEAGDFAADAGRQLLAPRQRLRVGVVLVVGPGELARGRLETGPHALQVAAGLVVRLSRRAGRAGEEDDRGTDAREPNVESRARCADRMLGHAAMVMRRTARCQTGAPVPGAGSGVAGRGSSR